MAIVLRYIDIETGTIIIGTLSHLHEVVFLDAKVFLRKGLSSYIPASLTYFGLDIYLFRAMMVLPL